LSVADRRTFVASVSMLTTVSPSAGVGVCVGAVLVRCAACGGATMKAKGKRQKASALRRRQKAKGKRQKIKVNAEVAALRFSFLTFAFCLLPFALRDISPPRWLKLSLGIFISYGAALLVVAAATPTAGLNLTDAPSRSTFTR